MKRNTLESNGPLRICMTEIPLWKNVYMVAQKNPIRAPIKCPVMASVSWNAETISIPSTPRNANSSEVILRPLTHLDSASQIRLGKYHYMYIIITFIKKSAANRGIIISITIFLEIYLLEKHFNKLG